MKMDAKTRNVDARTRGRRSILATAGIPVLGAAVLASATFGAGEAGAAVLPRRGVAVLPRQEAGPGSAGYTARVSRGEVTLEVRPSWSHGALAFRIAANTHSVDLARLDLSRLLRLAVDGRTLAPDSVGALEGHHARTTAWFSLPSAPERFTLEIRDVPDVPLRRLTWPAGDPGDPPPPPPSRGLVVVGGVAPGGLAVLEPGDLRVLRVVDGLEAVHGAALSGDGTRAYAMNMADAARAVSVIETATGRVRRVLGLPAPAHHATTAPEDDRAYVAYGETGLDPEAPRGVAAVAPSTGVVKVRPTEGTPYYLAPDPAGDVLYAAVRGTDRLLSLALPGLDLLATTKLSGSPSHLDVTSDGRLVFVALVDGRVAKVSAGGGTLDVVAEAETAPEAHAVALAGEPRRLFVANRGSGTITVLDPATLRREAVLDAVELPIHLLESPEGTLLISAGDTRELVEVDPSGLAVLDRVALPFQPHQSAGIP